MSTYLLTLSCFPCGDSKECNTEIEQKISAATHQEHRHNSEACTPFCTCSCCATSAFYQSVSHFNVQKVVFPAKKYPSYNTAFYSEISFSIWQPPQLG